MKVSAIALNDAHGEVSHRESAVAHVAMRVPTARESDDVATVRAPLALRRFDDAECVCLVDHVAVRVGEVRGQHR